jgi:hypothetical protein
VRVFDVDDDIHMDSPGDPARMHQNPLLQLQFTMQQEQPGAPNVEVDLDKYANARKLLKRCQDFFSEVENLYKLNLIEKSGLRLHHQHPRQRSRAILERKLRPRQSDIRRSMCIDQERCRGRLGSEH